MVSLIYMTPGNILGVVWVIYHRQCMDGKAASTSYLTFKTMHATLPLKGHIPLNYTALVHGLQCQTAQVLSTKSKSAKSPLEKWRIVLLYQVWSSITSSLAQLIIFQQEESDWMDFDLKLAMEPKWQQHLKQSCLLTLSKFSVSTSVTSIKHLICPNPSEPVVNQ